VPRTLTKVLDFGVAKLVADEHALTTPDACTPATQGRPLQKSKRAMSWS
jgi:hypothetical protein